MNSKGILEEIEVLITDLLNFEETEKLYNLSIEKELLLVILKAAERHFHQKE
jgi:hypothetical protein